MIEKNTIHNNVSILLILMFILTFGVIAQEGEKTKNIQDKYLLAARELILDIRYCAFITLDENGHPQARTMDPFQPDSNMVVWFGTNSNSRKVNEIRNNPKATLYYQASNARGYVVLKGEAFIIDDAEIKVKYWKPEWEAYYPESKDNFLVVKFVPKRLEVVDYKNRIVGDSITWEVPSIELK